MEITFNRNFLVQKNLTTYKGQKEIAASPHFFSISRLVWFNLFSLIFRLNSYVFFIIECHAAMIFSWNLIFFLNFNSWIFYSFIILSDICLFSHQLGIMKKKYSSLILACTNYHEKYLLFRTFSKVVLTQIRRNSLLWNLRYF